MTGRFFHRKSRQRFSVMALPRMTAALTKLRGSRRGNVMIIFAFSMIPMVVATGMGVDYARAARLQTKLNAIADAATLAAVTQPMMLKDDSAAGLAAYNMFTAQARALGDDLIFNPGAYKLSDNCDTDTSGNGLCIEIHAINNATSPGRIARVKYNAQSKNAFGGILGRPTIVIGGSSTANADKAPYIDFYLLLDTSPSMLLPVTTTGLAQMRSQTSTSYMSNGCAFACHTTNPHLDNIYIRDKNGKDIWLDPNNNYKAYAVDKVSNGYIYSSTYANSSVKIAKESTGYYADSYWLAQNNATFPTLQKPNIEMRIDAEQQAVRELVPTAKQIADDNKVQYRMAVYRFDYGPNFGTVADLTPLDTDTNMQSLIDKSTNLPMTYWYKNSWITSSSNINDQSTDFATAFNKMNQTGQSTRIPDPGSGATASDPQKVLFIITDGMSDENVSGIGRTHRELQPTHIDQCNAIKARNIRIAILYTEYIPESLTGDSWSQANVAPYLPNVAPQLQACASPGLYQKVSTDDSISDALQALFRQAVATAHLTQ